MAKHPKEPAAPPSRTGRYLFLFAAAAAAAAAYRYRGAEFVYVHGLRNGAPYVSRWRMVEDAWDHPRLKQLRAREKLDEVVAPGKTELEKIVLLRRWTRRQWDAARTFRYPPWDAVEILDLARKKRNYGFCAQYAIVFLQACRALGLHARYVDLGHFVAAVWSDEFNRWVLMDPTNDVHFERAGAPLSGRSLNEAAWSGDRARIERVGSDGSRAPASAEDLAPYKNYSIVLNNNQLAKPIAIEVAGKRSRLTHDDDFTKYPEVGGKQQIGFGAAFLAWRPPGRPPLPWPERDATDDPDDFRGRFNQTIILVGDDEPAKGTVRMKLLAENAPELAGYEVAVNGGAFRDMPEEFVWELAPGENALRARVKTAAGWRGPVSSVHAFYKKRNAL